MDGGGGGDVGTAATSATSAALASPVDGGAASFVSPIRGNSRWVDGFGMPTLSAAYQSPLSPPVESPMMAMAVSPRLPARASPSARRSSTPSVVGGCGQALSAEAAERLPGQGAGPFLPEPPGGACAQEASSMSLTTLHREFDDLERRLGDRVSRVECRLEQIWEAAFAHIDKKLADAQASLMEDDRRFAEMGDGLKVITEEFQGLVCHTVGMDARVAEAHSRSEEAMSAQSGSIQQEVLSAESDARITVAAEQFWSKEVAERLQLLEARLEAREHVHEEWAMHRRDLAEMQHELGAEAQERFQTLPTEISAMKKKEQRFLGATGDEHFLGATGAESNGPEDIAVHATGAESNGSEDIAVHIMVSGGGALLDIGGATLPSELIRSQREAMQATEQLRADLHRAQLRAKKHDFQIMEIVEKINGQESELRTVSSWAARSDWDAPKAGSLGGRSIEGHPDVNPSLAVAAADGGNAVGGCELDDLKRRVELHAQYIGEFRCKLEAVQRQLGRGGGDSRCLAPRPEDAANVRAAAPSTLVDEVQFLQDCVMAGEAALQSLVPRLLAAVQQQVGSGAGADSGAESPQLDAAVTGLQAVLSGGGGTATGAGNCESGRRGNCIPSSRLRGGGGTATGAGTCESVCRGNRIPSGRECSPGSSPPVPAGAEQRQDSGPTTATGP